MISNQKVMNFTMGNSRKKIITGNLVWGGGDLGGNDRWEWGGGVLTEREFTGSGHQPVVDIGEMGYI